MEGVDHNNNMKPRYQEYYKHLQMTDNSYVKEVGSRESK